MCEDAFMKAPVDPKDKVYSDFLHETSTMSVLEDDDQMSVASNTSRTSSTSFEESKFQRLSNDSEDSDYIVFPLSLGKAHPVCVRLN